MNIKSNIKKIWDHRRDLRSLFCTIYFNFHYLPLKQAIHLPILLYKPKLIKLDGKVVFADGVKIRYGMVHLGYPSVSLYPNAGIIFENKGGSLIFGGKCFIGNNSAISIGRGANMIIGDSFSASTSLKIVNYYFIDIKQNVRFGWDCLVMDTDFHKLTKLKGGYSKGYGAIKLGSYSWIANGCKIMKRTDLPNYTTVAAGSIISGKIDAPEYSIIGHSRKIEVLYTGIYRNQKDDAIEYENSEL